MLSSRIEHSHYKDGIVDTLMRQKGEFHVVAQLAPPAPKQVLEDALYAWVGRINRHYIGRNWTAPHYAEARMAGAVFFEESGGCHAHLVVRPPADAPRFHFFMNAPYWFRPSPEWMRPFCPKPISRSGKMYIDPVRAGPADLRKLLSYVAKGLEWAGGEERYKFLDELQPRQVV